MGLIENIKKRLSGTSKGQVGVGSIAPFAMGLGLGVAILAIMTAVVAGVQDGFTANTAEYNVTTAGLTGLLNFSDQFGLIGTIMGFAIVLAVVVGGLYVYQRMSGGNR